MKDVVILDLETGGLNPERHAVLSICMKKYGSDEKLFLYIKPYGLIDDKALEVNGLNIEKLEAEGVDFSTAANKIYYFIKDNFEDRPKILGQNVKFDIGFLKQLFVDANEKRLPKLDFESLFHYHHKDTMIVSEFLKDAGILPSDINTRLSNVYEYLTGQKANQAHTADFDVYMTEEVYKHQIGLLKTYSELRNYARKIREEKIEQEADL